jgi:hypothetical protein
METDKGFKKKFKLKGTRKELKFLKSRFKKYEYSFELREIKQDKSIFNLSCFK